MRYQEWTTPGESDLFEIPDDCWQIYVTACGAGGGGGGSSTSTGANGGGASPCVVRFPLTVQAGGVLAVYVGVGGSGGVGGASTNSFGRHTGIVGRALIDFLCTHEYPGLPFFIVGWGGESSLGTPCIPDYAWDTYSPTATLGTSGNAPQWVGKSMTSTWPWANVGPAAREGSAQAPPSNPRTYGVVGVNTINGRGYGLALASDATYSSGGPGGGGVFGKGGTSGQYSGAPGNGGAASGYGAGGGGGSGTPGSVTTGGDGTGGYLRIDY